jgi:ribonuclease P/MRP protein subunit RPP1
LQALVTVGYTTVALSHTVSGKLPATLAAPALPSNAPKPLTILSRITLTLAEGSQNQRLTNLGQTYSLVALRPINEKTLSQACLSLECDIISLDLSARLPYYFKFKTLAAAIARGIRFEICYGPGITGSGLEARRNLIGNATALIRATRGRGIIISSEARRALGVRAPWDVVNLACVWGLTQERGKEAVCEEARKVVALAGMKRTSYRGVIDVVHGGEPRATQPDGKGRTEGRATPKSANGTKRKATDDTETGTSVEPPLSKREMKRRAKKARLEASQAEASATSSPKT